MQKERYMYVPEKAAAENESIGVSNSSIQKKENVKQRFEFVDNRPKPIAQQILMSANTNGALLQRAINVELVNDSPTKKTLVARGAPDSFEEGSSAGGSGWIGVTKYRSEYSRITESGIGDVAFNSGNLQNKFTNPEAGHVLGKQNGGNGQDSDNIFAQDGGANNSSYKVFEGKMRKDLDVSASFDDHVEFVSYLVGESINKGTIKDEALSEASDISDDDRMEWLS